MKVALSLFIVLGTITFLIPLAIQIIVCKNTKGRLGLILPILSLVTTIFYCIGQYSFDSFGGEMISTIPGLIVGLVIGNIPTLIYFLIYLHYKNLNKQNDELDTMEIMDMWQPGIIPGFLILHFVTNDGDKTTLSNACTGL